MKAVVLLFACAAGPASAFDVTSPIAAGSEPPPPWHVVGLPHQSKPFTHFTRVDLEGQHVLRVDADHSYGNLVHALPSVPATTLSWRWRVDQPVRGADLHKRSGEDSALKVCASFGLPSDRVPFLERQWLALAQMRSTEKLPTATLCYLWDNTLPDRTLVVSPFTRRIRSITLRGSGTLGQWSNHTQDLAADFLRAFGDESQSVPRVIAVALGADSDNTASHSVGYVADIHLNDAR